MNTTAAVIDFNQYRKAPVQQLPEQNGFVPVIVGYYPIYAFVPAGAENTFQPQAEKQEVQNENNVVSIYDYLGEI